MSLDLFGAREFITDQTGIRVPATTPEATARAFAAAIDCFAALSAEEKQRVSAASVARAATLEWHNRVRDMEHIYAEAIESVSGKDRVTRTQFAQDSIARCSLQLCCNDTDLFYREANLSAQARSTTALVVNCWDDSNKGDAAISIGVLNTLSFNEVADRLQVTSYIVHANEAEMAHAFRHVRGSYPTVELVPCHFPALSRSIGKFKALVRFCRSALKLLVPRFCPTRRLTPPFARQGSSSRTAASTSASNPRAWPSTSITCSPSPTR